MFKNLLSIVLVVSFIITPFAVAHAENDDSENDILAGQLSAISSYLTRSYELNKAPLTEKELQDSIHAGVVWFKNAQEESGHFKYEYVPYEGTYRHDDNIVRQAGGLYALGEIIRKTDDDTLKLSNTIEKAIAYFEDTSKEDTREGKTFRCILKSEASMRCPLGATSLALVGILSYVDANPKKEPQYRDLIGDYRTYILTMQKENGGFRDLYTIGSTVLRDAESSFSNGEALLALVRYYEYNPDGEVKKAIDATFTYLKVQPYDANLYLWIMAALKDMNQLWPNEAYVTYAKDFTNWRIERAVATRSSQRNYCAYAEGLASAVSILDESVSKSELSLIENELNRLNRKHFALQLTGSDTYRILTKGGTLTLETLRDAELAEGGFLTEDSEPTQRIDFTQHCLNTYLQTLVDIQGKSLK